VGTKKFRLAAAVRAAVSDLGSDALPSEVRAWVAARHSRTAVDPFTLHRAVFVQRRRLRRLLRAALDELGEDVPLCEVAAWLFMNAPEWPTPSPGTLAVELHRLRD
jgi:hypothetical protein